MGLLDDVKNKVSDGGADALKEAIKGSGIELSDEQLDAIAGGLQDCETEEELKDLIQQAGYELSDEQLDEDGVSSACWSLKCHKHKIHCTRLCSIASR